MYWQLYEVCFLKIIDSDLKDFIPGPMLHAGVIDAELLTEAELIAEVKWTNPVEGRLVGAYYDYIESYKKNPRLSPTAKEKLYEFVKKTRSVKDRFSQDYIAWLNF